MDLFEQPAHRQLDDNHAIRRLALCGAAALIAGEMFVMIEESTKSSVGPSRRPGDGRPWGVVALWTSCSIKGGCHPQQKVSADRGPAAMERRHSSYRIRDRWMTAISDGARRRVKLAAIAQDRNWVIFEVCQRLDGRCAEFADIAARWFSVKGSSNCRGRSASDNGHPFAHPPDKPGRQRSSQPSQWAD